MRGALSRIHLKKQGLGLARIHFLSQMACLATLAYTINAGLAFNPTLRFF
jgi:cell division inhibitor SulA